MSATRIERLAETIKNLNPSAGKTTIVAIDGCAGSGKSTFAGALSSSLGCPIIHTDDFASWDVPLEWWPRMLSQVLAPFAAGQAACYQRYDWSSNQLADWKEVAAPLVIIEGVSSLRREFRPYIAFGIWVECPRELRLRRGLERDGYEALPDWNRWMDAEDAYVDSHKPDHFADLRVLGGPCEGPLEDEFIALQ